MISKYILLAISMMANNTKHDAIESQASIKYFIKKTIRNELMNNIFRILIGILLLVIIIFSLTKFEAIFSTYLDQYQNSMVFTLLIFGMLVIVGLVLLFLLFKSTPGLLFTKKLKPVENKIAIEKLITAFISGFFEKLEMKK